MIDAEKVKAFWEKRAEKFGKVSFESIVTLEEDTEALVEKIKVETESVFALLGDISGRSILDLGAGVGQWSFRFIERGALSVTAVEYASNLVRIGREEVARRGLKGIEFIEAPAEKFVADRKFDIVYISGLFVYLNDDQVSELMLHLLDMLKPRSGILLLRDGTGIEKRHVINQKMSVHLGTKYSAVYRSREEYLALFSEIGLTCNYDQDVFPEAHSLNKYHETRLRFYLFKN